MKPIIDIEELKIMGGKHCIKNDVNTRTQDQKVMKKNRVEKGHHIRHEINTQPISDGKEPNKKGHVLHKIEYILIYVPSFWCCSSGYHPQKNSAIFWL
jgi:hypothetical protein